MDSSSRSRGRQGCLAVLFEVETLGWWHYRQAADQATNTCKTRWALCSADDSDPSAIPPALAPQYPVPRSALAVSVAAALLGVGLLLGNWWKSSCQVEVPHQAWARREVGCSGIA